MINITSIYVALGMFVVAVLGYITGNMRNAKAEGKREGTIETTLNSISADVKNVKDTMKEMKDDFVGSNKELESKVNNVVVIVTEQGKDIARLKERIGAV